jgi:hypothetical protein
VETSENSPDSEGQFAIPADQLRGKTAKTTNTTNKSGTNVAFIIGKLGDFGEGAAAANFAN